MSALLREWNDASKPRRKKLLEWFRDQFQWTHFRGEFERECGADVALFLARILVWMQKTTSALPAVSELSMTTTTNATCFALSDQLACIQLFFTSANIHAYYREFQQADGLTLLLRVLGSPRGQSDGVGVSDADRAVILDILHRISQRGRSHKEEISRHGGELAMIRGALAGSQACNDMDSTLWTLCRDALLEQLVGNPNSLDQVHGVILFMLQHPEAKVQIFGAQILRHLITPDSFYVDLKYRNAKAVELVALGMTILQSSDIHLQHEGLELVHSLLQNEQLQGRICQALVEWTKQTVLVSEPVDERLAPIQSSREYETFSHMRSPFVHAAQSINTLMHSTPAILPIMVMQCEVLMPLSFGLLVERPQSMKWYAAAIAIHFVFTKCPQAAAAHLARIFALSMKRLLSWRTLQPEDLAAALLQSEDHQRMLTLQFYENGWRKPIRPKRDASSASADPIDLELSEIEADINAAVRDYVPELQWQPHHDLEYDERDLYCDDMDEQCEQQMRVQLQRHFAQFRISSWDSAGLPSPVRSHQNG